MRLQQAIDDFLLAKRAGNRSAATLSKYELTLLDFAAFVANADLATITAPQVRSYLDHCRSKGNAAETLETYYRTLHAFFNWAALEYALPHNPLNAVDKPRVKRRLPDYLTHEQLAALLAAIDGPRAARDRAILLFLLDTGVRAGELCGLQRSDIDLAQGQAQVSGKDQRERLVCFYELTSAALIAYWQQRSDTLPAAFVTTHAGQLAPLTRNALQQLFDRLSARVGFHVHPHLMRHTFAAYWIISGGDEESLRRMMGHTSPAMTQRYVALRTKDLQAKHRQYSPVKSLLGGTHATTVVDDRPHD